MLLIIVVLIVKKITTAKTFILEKLFQKCWGFTFMITCFYRSKVNKCSLKYQKELYFFIIVGLVIWTILKYSWNKFDTEFLEAIYLITFMLKLSKPQVRIGIYLVGVYYDRKIIEYYKF